MIFYAIVAVVLILFVVWFARTSLFRAHRGRRGKDVGQAGRGPVGWWQ
jgi:hypothetical protein